MSKDSEILRCHLTGAPYCFRVGNVAIKAKVVHRSARELAIASLDPHGPFTLWRHIPAFAMSQLPGFQDDEHAMRTIIEMTSVLANSVERLLSLTQTELANSYSRYEKERAYIPARGLNLDELRRQSIASRRTVLSGVLSLQQHQRNLRSLRSRLPETDMELQMLQWNLIHEFLGDENSIDFQELEQWIRKSSEGIPQ